MNKKISFNGFTIRRSDYCIIFALYLYVAPPTHPQHPKHNKFKNLDCEQDYSSVYNFFDGVVGGGMHGLLDVRKFAIREK